MDAALRCINISKAYVDVNVLTGVDLEVAKGEIHVVLGENGAGKSTLMKIAAGLLRPDAGEIEIGGSVMTGATVTQAQAAGLALIHQEPRLFPDLTVHENVWIDEPSRRGARVHLSDLEERTVGLLAELGCRVSPGDRVGNLSVADQQMVDIAAALRRDLRLLIVDEPTASLTPSEVQRLFTVLKGLRERGVAVLFIGHRLHEVLEIGDRITVLRDGHVVATRDAKQTDEDELVRLMVGRDITAVSRSCAASDRAPVLEVRDLASPGAFVNVSFEVRAGEILGIGGLVGAGRSEVLEAVFGVRRRSAGQVHLGHGQSIKTPRQAIRCGLGLVPEDRAHQGLVLTRTIGENIVAPNLKTTSKFGIRRERRERSVADTMMQRFQVKARSSRQLPRELSGGNQQKVSLAKWLVNDLEVLLVDEPTRGVDIGSKTEIHSLLLAAVERGMAVVMVSSDMRELLSLADRIIVMREGRITGELDGRTATEEGVLRLAAQAAA